MGIVKSAKITHIVVSAMMIASGLCLAVWPQPSMHFICWMIGGICILAGIAKLIGYFSNDIYRLAFQFDLALGIFTILLGIVFLFQPEKFIRFVPALVGLYVIIESLFKLQTALDARRFGLAHWGWIFAAAVITGAFGLVLVFNPFHAAVVITVLLGVALMLDGIENICVTAYTVRVRERKRSFGNDGRFVN